MIFKRYPFCMEPLPDELPCSVMLRTAKAMGRSPNSFFQEIFGSKIKAKEALRTSYRLDPYFDIGQVYPHTGLPWCFIRLTRTQQRLSINNRLHSNPNETRPPYISGQFVKSIAYCPECVLEDLEKFGIGYFHAMHQMKGITVCPKHGTRLIFSDKNWPSLEEVKIAAIQGTDIEKEVASLAYRSLGTSMDDWIPLFREKYDECGLIVKGYLNRGKLLEFIKSFYSGSFYDPLVQFDSHIHLPWPINIPVLEVPSGHLPDSLRIILMAKAFGIEPPKRKTVMPKPFKCPACGSLKLKKISGGVKPYEDAKCLDCGAEISLTNEAYQNLNDSKEITDNELIVQAGCAINEMKRNGETIKRPSVDSKINRHVQKAPWTNFLIRAENVSTVRELVKVFLKTALKSPVQNIIDILEENKGVADDFLFILKTLTRLNENYLREKGALDG